MSGDISAWTGEVHQGDAVEVMSEMPESSVHSVIFSPPYYGLRDYQTDGQIGLEDTLDGYIQSLVEVGREIQRVLRDDGSWWLNLGDTYSGGGGIAGKPDDWEDMHNDETYPSDPPAKTSRLPSKCKMLVPHRVAIQLVEDGWIVRNDSIWLKRNPMPESVTDRLSTRFEFLFHFVQQQDYYYDLDAIREPYKNQERYKYSFEENESQKQASSPAVGAGKITPNELGKNPGDVFELSTAAYKDAHFAVYPKGLIEKPIGATCPQKACVACGTPYERDVEEEVVHRSELPKSDPRYRPGRYQNEEPEHSMKDMGVFSKNIPKGWIQACGCETDETEPGVVLDPFIGSGTTAVVAEEKGRRWVGIDLNNDYVDMSVERVHDETNIDTQPITDW